MPVPYAASRQDVKINLGYIASRSVSYLKRAMFHISPILLATYTQPEPTVFDAVMRTYLACWQGNFGLGGLGETGIPRSQRGSRGPGRSGGHGADGEREAAPRGQPRKGRRQVQDDPAHGALDPHGELDQPLPQRADLGPGAGRAPRTLQQ